MQPPNVYTRHIHFANAEWWDNFPQELSRRRMFARRFRAARYGDSMCQSASTWWRRAAQRAIR